ncbi:MAG: hypothetical protein E7467_08085 [Ruminococcaceae bacterium]|nr:hypothetical protein [Oscillospiraceae bacterium]
MRIGRQPLTTPVTDLQEMLRAVYPESTLSKDGYFGEETKALLERFQHEQNLPVNGIADEDTWNALSDAFDEANTFYGEAEPLLIVLQPNQVLQKGSKNTHLYLLQGILIALSRYYDQMPIVRSTGILDADTGNALSWFQERSELPVTGELDKKTWRHLAKHYRTIVGDGSGSFPIRIAE